MNSLKRMLRLAILTGLFLFLLTSCTQEPVKVAVIARLESGSIMGMSTWDQVKFFEERNDSKGIEFYPYNDDGSREGIEKVYEELKAEGIDIIVTAHKSDSGIWLSELIQKDGADKIMFAAGTTTDLLTGLDDNFIRFVQSAHQEQKAAVSYIKEKGFKDVLIIRDIDNISYADTALKSFDENYDFNFELIDINVKNIDFVDLENQLKLKKYDLVYLVIGDYNVSSGAIAQLAVKVRPDTKILYNGWMKTQGLLETAGESLKQSAMLSHYPARGENDILDKYLVEFFDSYGYTPNTIGITVYKIIDALNQSVESGNSTPDEIKTFMIQKKTINTELADVVLDEYGDSIAPFYFIQDIYGEFK